MTRHWSLVSLSLVLMLVIAACGSQAPSPMEVESAEQLVAEAEAEATRIIADAEAEADAIADSEPSVVEELVEEAANSLEEETADSGIDARAVIAGQTTENIIVDVPDVVETTEEVVEEDTTEDVVEEDATEDVVEEDTTEDVVEEDATEDVVEEDATEDVIEEETAVDGDFVLVSAEDDPMAIFVELADPARGEELFNEAINGLACVSCHLPNSADMLVGPGQLDLIDRANTRVSGEGPYTYMFNSVRNSQAYIVEGYPEGVMPMYDEETLSDQDIYHLVAYMASLTTENLEE